MKSQTPFIIAEMVLITPLKVFRSTKELDSVYTGPPRPRADAIIVDWDDNDPSNPLNWPITQKWLITLAACFICFIVGTNSTAIASASVQVTERFSVSDKAFPNDYWLLASWSAGAAFAPLVALPLMEHYGLRLSFLVC